MQLLVLHKSLGQKKSKFQVKRLIQYSNFDTLSSLVQKLILFDDFLHFLLLVTAALSQQQPFSKHSTFASNSPDDVHLSWQVSRLPLPPDPGSSSWMVVEWMPACGRTPCPRWCWWCTHFEIRPSPSLLIYLLQTARHTGTLFTRSIITPPSYILLIHPSTLHFFPGSIKDF